MNDNVRWLIGKTHTSRRTLNGFVVTVVVNGREYTASGTTFDEAVDYLRSVVAAKKVRRDTRPVSDHDAKVWASDIWRDIGHLRD